MHKHTLKEFSFKYPLKEEIMSLPYPRVYQIKGHSQEWATSLGIFVSEVPSHRCPKVAIYCLAPFYPPELDGILIVEDNISLSHRTWRNQILLP